MTPADEYDRRRRYSMRAPAISRAQACSHSGDRRMLSGTDTDNPSGVTVHATVSDEPSNRTDLAALIGATWIRAGGADCPSSAKQIA